MVGRITLKNSRTTSRITPKNIQISFNNGNSQFLFSKPHQWL